MSNPVIEELVLGIVDDLNELNDDPDSHMGEYPGEDDFEYDADHGTIEFTNTKDKRRYRIDIWDVTDVGTDLKRKQPGDLGPSFSDQEVEDQIVASGGVPASELYHGIDQP
jgi:hypothetical protein